MKTTMLLLLAALFLSFHYSGKKAPVDLVIASGKMPNMAMDKSNNVHLVYGSGDSIWYVSSGNGKDFTTPELIAVLPRLFASAMRGPQIAVSDNGITVMACTHTGNIFSYTKVASGKWTKAVKINEVNGSAMEALIALSAQGRLTYAVWLGVKNPSGQSVYGASSDDGGKTWRKNVLVYASPDNTVCECCKPSVVVKGKTIYVMFRNWLKGNRDLYVIQSADGGRLFNQAQKQGEGSWKLDGCPMDGGGLAVDNNGMVQTVWRREGKIYAATAGITEKEIGEGKGCTMATVQGKTVYAWVQQGAVMVMNAQGTKTNVGKGSLPQIKALNGQQVICVWENDGQIHASVLDI